MPQSPRFDDYLSVQRLDVDDQTSNYDSAFLARAFRLPLRLIIARPAPSGILVVRRHREEGGGSGLTGLVEFGLPMPHLSTSAKINAVLSAS